MRLGRPPHSKRSRATLSTLLCAAIGLTALAPAPAVGDSITSDQIEALLIAENAATRPGDSVTVALHKNMAPGWHTYWKNPGDSGQPAAVIWELPQGSTASEASWPTPERIPYGPLVNFGYSDPTTLLFEITVPPNWKAGEDFPVAADAEILVCEEICIPVTGRLSLAIPTGTASETDPRFARLFAEARSSRPLPSPWPVTASLAGDQLALTLSGPASDFTAVSGAFLFADEWGTLDHAAEQGVEKTQKGLTLTVPLGHIPPGEDFSGIVKLAQGEAPGRAFLIATVALSEGNAPITESLPNIALLIGLALAGGLLLNLMPCVFPVLAMKASGLAGQLNEPRRQRVLHGLMYSAGVVLSFLSLGIVLLLLRAGGAEIGWGFQLQEPLAVGILAYVIMGVGLNLSGVFEFGNSLSRLAGYAKIGTGHAGSFATGILAAVVAAPCTAPFMAAAIGGALLLPGPAALLVFVALGLGLALPYLALSGLPALTVIIPHPGPWMVRFKQLLAFPMYATAAWLVWILSQQAGPDAAFMVTLGLVAIAFAAWALPEGLPSSEGKARAVRLAPVVLPLVLAAGLLGRAAALEVGPPRTEDIADIAEPFSRARLENLLEAGEPVFVNMTAAWCITCKVNERVALSGPQFKDLLERADITYLKGDWTNRDPEITRFLERFGRIGVPLYVFFPGNSGEPQVLPQVLSPNSVKDAFSSIASGQTQDLSQPLKG